jgi:hypothetical protein
MRSGSRDKKAQNFIDHEIPAGRFGDSAELVSFAVRHLLVARGTWASRDQIDAKIAIRSHS